MARIEKKPTDKFGRPLYFCPKNHATKQHGVRNRLVQYYCPLCNQYYTKGSRFDHFYEDSNYFDGFISDYIDISLQNKKPSISKLCDAHNVSRASVYRHLLDKNKRLVLDMLIQLKCWASSIFEGRCKIKVKNKELVVTSPRDDLRLHLFPILISNGVEPMIQISYMLNEVSDVHPPIDTYQKLEILFKKSVDQTFLFDQLSMLIEAC